MLATLKDIVVNLKLEVESLSMRNNELTREQQRNNLQEVINVIIKLNQDRERINRRLTSLFETMEDNNMNKEYFMIHLNSFVTINSDQLNYLPTDRRLRLKFQDENWNIQADLDHLISFLGIYELTFNE